MSKFTIEQEAQALIDMGVKMVDVGTVEKLLELLRARRIHVLVLNQDIETQYTLGIYSSPEALDKARNEFLISEEDCSLSEKDFQAFSLEVDALATRDHYFPLPTPCHVCQRLDCTHPLHPHAKNIRPFSP